MVKKCLFEMLKKCFYYSCKCEELIACVLSAKQGSLHFIMKSVEASVECEFLFSEANLGEKKL